MTDSTLNNEATAELIESERWERYGCVRDIRPLFSNNPDAYYQSRYEWSPKKRISAIEYPALYDDTEVYEKTIHPVIMATLKDWDLLKSQAFNSLHPIRLGFDDGPDKKTPQPTLWLIMHKGCITRVQAKAFVQDLERKLSDILAGIGGDTKERIFIDVCESGKEVSQSLEYTSLDGVAQRHHASTIFDDEFPRIGTSIGALEHTGTLGFYIRHDYVTYAVTNNHIVRCVLPPGVPPGQICAKIEPACRSTNENKDRLIEYPSPKDYKRTLDSLAWEIECAQVAVQFFTEECPSPSRVAEKTRYLHEQNRLLQRAKLHKCSLGKVIATSGTKFSDVAIIEVREDFQSRAFNKTQVTQENDRSLGSTLFKCSKLTKTPEQRTALIKLRSSIPGVDRTPFPFGPIVKERFTLDKVYFKPPSARSGWTAGLYNGLQSTVYGESEINTREHCFIHVEAEKPFSQNGDCGSSVVNENLEVVGMLWGGSILQIPGLTFVTPISDVMTGIEKIMGWEAGDWEFSVGGSWEFPVAGNWEFPRA